MAQTQIIAGGPRVLHLVLAILNPKDSCINPAVCFMVRQALDDLSSTTTGFWAMQPMFNFRSGSVKTPGDLVEEEKPKTKINELQKLAIMAGMFQDDILAHCGLMCGCHSKSQFFLGGTIVQ